MKLSGEFLNPKYLQLDKLDNIYYSLVVIGIGKLYLAVTVQRGGYYLIKKVDIIAIMKFWLKKVEHWIDPYRI